MATVQNAVPGMVDPAIFEQLQANIDEDTQFREELRSVLQKLERQGRLSQSFLARAHSTPAAELESMLSPASSPIGDQVILIGELATVASRQNYYRYNGLWTRDVQNTIYTVMFYYWLGIGPMPQGSLPTIKDVGSTFRVPVNVKDRDTFQITTEEYLHALISLVEELARLAVNSVTLGDFQRPLQISKFVKDLHAGFQILNLKNDSLRKRSDSIKYNVKKIEDVVYDLSLRNLVPRSSS